MGCGEGGCGACTVMVSRRRLTGDNAIEHRSVNACLAPLCSVDGCSVTTVEGIVQKDGTHTLPRANCEDARLSVWILHSWHRHVSAHAVDK